MTQDNDLSSVSPRRGWLAATITLILLDILWIVFYMKNKYDDIGVRLGVSGEQYPALVRVLLSVLIYALLSYAMLVFVLQNSELDIKESALYGAILGLAVYGVFDMTNMIFLGPSFPWTVALTDVVWGTLLIGISCAVGKTFAQWEKN